MNSYRPVFVALHEWAVEWSADGIVRGLLPDRYDSGADATEAIIDLLRADWWLGRAGGDVREVG
jgi:hypothetical protein